MSLAAEQIEILLELPEGCARPGQPLRGGLRLNVPEPLPVQRLEASVVWYTEGRGDKDEGVAWHQTLAENEELDSQRAFPLEIPMPDSPWTYDGKLIKIRWVVRVRVKPQGESETAGEKPFDLLPPGRVPMKDDDGDAA